MTLKSENALFLMTRNQTLLQDPNKSFQDVHRVQKCIEFHLPPYEIAHLWSHYCACTICYFNIISFCFHLQPQNLCDIEQVTRIEVSKEDEVSYKIDIHLKDPDKEVTFASILT